MKACPTCKTEMQQRSGKFGDFLFCPQQHICKQKTITVSRYSDINDYSHIEPSYSALEGEMLRDTLYLEASALEGGMGGMVSMAYENNREHEYTRDRASVDANDVLFGGGMFCDMGMEDDDEDQRPW